MKAANDSDNHDKELPVQDGLSVKPSSSGNPATSQTAEFGFEDSDQDAPDSSCLSKGSLSNGDTDTNITEPSLETVSDDDHDAASITSEDRLEMIRKKWEEDPLYDSGYFTQRNVYVALNKDNLDEARMRRLKIGFQRLLASLNERFADFDGLTFTN